jgi:hypothetical protein
MPVNPPIGNNFIEGVLGVVRVTFNSVNMGKTTADTEIVPDQDIKDILFQQDGTKYADKVRTGIVYQVNCTFGQLTTARVAELDQGYTVSGGGNSMSMGRSLYISWLETFAAQLILTRVDSEGTSSTDPFFRMVFPKAAPEITGNYQYGADTQRNLAVTFHIFYDETLGTFGYFGYASSLGF